METLSSEEIFNRLKITNNILIEPQHNYIWGDTSDPKKLEFLLTLVKNKFSDKKILEIGTYRGSTSYLISKGISSGTLYTCDCGFEAFKDYLIEEENEHGNKVKYSNYEIGEIYKNKETSHLINQLIGNTRDKEFQKKLFEKSPFDLIYVDASHTYEGIKNDTELAFKLLSSNGIIIWDDYNGHWLGVNKYLDELAKEKKLIYNKANRYVVYGLN